MGGSFGPPGLMVPPGLEVGIDTDEASVVETAVNDDTLRGSKYPWIGPVGAFRVGSWMILVDGSVCCSRLAMLWRTHFRFMESVTVLPSGAPMISNFSYTVA